MESIFASKLYKASTRKDRIHAALIAPTNLGLVKQLADSLDEEYQTPENLDKDYNDKKEEEVDKFESFEIDEEIDPSKDLVTMDDLGKSSGAPKHSTPKSSPKLNSKPSGAKPSDSADKEESKEDVSDLMPESPANEIEPAEASTNIKSSTVIELTSLKTTLNNREDTAGVSRIAEKENEIWIYYNDDINLNNVMTEVIECLMNSGYDSVEFNRLARSDNAIVFVRVIETPKEPEDIEEAK